MRWCLSIIAALMSMACSVLPDETTTTTLCFSAAPTGTKASANLGDYFSKLNLMLFDDHGDKMMDKVKTQTVEEGGDFGSVSLALAEGRYTVVAVGHSSKVSATIKSPEMVQFTASEGEKLTDTFCYYGTIEVGKESKKYSLTMERRVAMFRLVLTDTSTPEAITKMKFDYTGGSANFNPCTGLGCTKSTQSENRSVSENRVYEIYTFPYLSETGTLKITVSALDKEGGIIRQRVFTDVPVTVNQITTYKGPFFSEGDGNVSQSGFGFLVDGDWDEETIHQFTF